MEVYVMNEEILLDGIVKGASIRQPKSQDYIEIELKDGQVVVMTASIDGRLKIGIKIENT